MSGYLRRLATTGAAYTAASVVSKLIAVALLPLYTRYLTPTDYGAAEVMFAAVVSASIVVRFGMIEALLRFYYKDGEDPATGRRHLLRDALLDLDRGGADRPALRPADLRSAAQRSERRTQRPAGGRTRAHRDRRALGADDDGVPAHPVPARGARPRLLRDHAPQRRRDDRADRRARRRPGRGRARDIDRQLRERRRLRRSLSASSTAAGSRSGSTARCCGG